MGSSHSRSPRSEYKAFLRDFWDTQTQTFENRGQGWIFWTWKAAVSFDDCHFTPVISLAPLLSTARRMVLPGWS